MSLKTNPECFSDEEAQRRFEATLKAALNTPPKPLKDAPRKRAESKGKPAGKLPITHICR